MKATVYFNYPEAKNRSRRRCSSLCRNLEWSSESGNIRSFLRKFEQMGGIVEEMIDAEEVRSPSVQMRIYPDGKAVLVSSHEQVLGGNTGQVYLGCRFPAREEYRLMIQEQARRIGEVLSEKGVIGRFGIDFLLTRARVVSGNPMHWRSTCAWVAQHRPITPSSF